MAFAFRSAVERGRPCRSRASGVLNARRQHALANGRVPLGHLAATELPRVGRRCPELGHAGRRHPGPPSPLSGERSSGPPHPVQPYSGAPRSSAFLLPREAHVPIQKISPPVSALPPLASSGHQVCVSDFPRLRATGPKCVAGPSVSDEAETLVASRASPPCEPSSPAPLSPLSPSSLHLTDTYTRR